MASSQSNICRAFLVRGSGGLETVPTSWYFLRPLLSRRAQTEPVWKCPCHRCRAQQKEAARRVKVRWRGASCSTTGGICRRRWTFCDCVHGSCTFTEVARLVPPVAGPWGSSGLRSCRPRAAHDQRSATSSAEPSARAGRFASGVRSFGTHARKHM